MSRVIVTGAPGPGLWAAAAALISQGWEPLEPPEGELDPLEAHALEVLGDRDPGSVAASPVLATLCERALALARGTWLVPPPLAEGWEAEPALAPIANSFRSIVGVGDRWVWADPRALLLLPWLRVLLAPGSVVVVVTGSAASVEGEVAPLGVLPAHAWALWSRYRSAAVVDGGPFLIVDQEALSGDATTVAERLAALVGAPMSEPVAWLDESPPDELADEILDRERELHLAAIRATAFVPTDGPPTAGFSITAALQALLTERQALSAEVGRLQERAESVPRQALNAMAIGSSWRTRSGRLRRRRFGSRDCLLRLVWWPASVMAIGSSWRTWSGRLRRRRFGSTLSSPRSTGSRPGYGEGSGSRDAGFKC